MTIEIHTNENIFTIEDMDRGDDITLIESSGGQLEIEVSIEAGEDIIRRDFTLSRKQMIELKNWIVERLR